MPQLPPRPRHMPSAYDLRVATASLQPRQPPKPAYQASSDSQQPTWPADQPTQPAYQPTATPIPRTQYFYSPAAAYPPTSSIYTPAQYSHTTPQHSQQAAQPMDYSQYGSASSYTNPQEYPNYQYPGNNQYAQSSQQQYQTAPPQIRNPFVPPPPARSLYSNQNASFDPVHEQEIAQWQSTYAPQEQYEGKKGGKDAKSGNANLTALGVRPGATPEVAADGKAKVDGEKKKTVVRHGGGETWEDETLLEWDPSKFRIYVGNLAGEVTDDSLAKAFAAYEVNKARVIRDKRTTKSKGFGFVEFTDHELGFKAAREMVGKYVGSHPITIQKAKTDVNATVQKDKKGKYGKGRDRGGKKQDDPLRANTGAHIEKKPVKNVSGLKVLG